LATTYIQDELGRILKELEEELVSVVEERERRSW